MTIDWTQGDDWDTLYLGGEVVPGVATVSARAKDGRDQQKSRGSRGKRTRQDGSPGVAFKVTVEMLPGEADDFRERILPILYKRSVGGVGDPLSIAHPQAAIFGITAVTVGDIDSPPPKSGGTWRVSWDMDDWVPEPKEAKKPAAIPGPVTAPPGVQPPLTLQELAEENAFG